MADDMTQPRLDDLRDRLRPFLEQNSEASIAQVGEHAVILNPWADDSVQIRLRESSDELVEALNNVRFPVRFSAIWHTDSDDLEFIFAPLPPDYFVRNRSFDFGWRGRTLHCEYCEGSNRLRAIADAFRAGAPTSLNGFRNLPGINRHSKAQKLSPGSDLATRFTVISFWIRQVGCSEAEIVELARHLNFYMFYFDRRTPRVLIHDEPAKEAAPKKSSEDSASPFPKSVAARRLDPYLLDLWETATAGDSFKRFLYSYQVLEYGAFYYIQEAASQGIRKILGWPDLPSRPGEAVRLILEATAANRMEDESKIVALMKQIVDPATIWSEMGPELGIFSADIRFDGGFTLDALVKPGWTFDDFRSAWIPKLPDSFRKLRNALVHSREARMAAGIPPSSANYKRIEPWSRILLTCAIQVIQYLNI